MQQFEEFSLSNGIPVLFLHHDGPVATFQWWVRTGSVDEAPSEYGFAHFLEHMSFKDYQAKKRKRPSEGRIAKQIESLGGEINAYTSFEQTVYLLNCAEENWEKSIGIYGQMAAPEPFLKTDFEREREVILEEIRRSNDSPGRRLSQELFKRSFGSHPYARPVIGYERVLNQAKPVDLERFRKNHYVPSRMGLVLVGPLSSARKTALLKILEKWFGELREAGHPNVRKTSKKVPIRPGVSTFDFDVVHPSAMLAFRTPAMGGLNSIALDVLTSVLASGDLSRLSQKLFFEKSLVNSVSGGFYGLEDAGLVFFQLDSENSNKLDEATAYIFEELKRIQNQEIDQEEWDRVVTQLESDRLYASQSTDSIANREGYARFVEGNPHFEELYLRKVQTLTRKEISDAAKLFLDPQYYCGVRMLPRKTEPSVSSEESFSLVKRVLKSPVLSTIKKKAIWEEVRSDQSTSPGGIKVSSLRHPGSPVFSISAVALGGTRLEEPEFLGLSGLMADTWTEGTATKTPHQVRQLVESLAAEVYGISGRNLVGLEMTGLKKDWSQLSDLFVEILSQPLFDAKELEHSKRVARDSIRSVEDQSSRLLSQLFSETLFSEHPYGRLPSGTLDSVDRMQAGDLARQHAKWIQPDRLSIGISGDLPAEQIQSMIQQLEGRLGRSSGYEAPILQDQSLTAPRWVSRAKGREQTHLMVGGIGLKFSSADRFAVRLLTTILSGQSGRLFVELREKKSLAYTVAPVLMEGIENGYFATYIATAPQKKEEAEKGIQVVLERLSQKGPTAVELKRAQEYFLGSRAMDLQTESAHANRVAFQRAYGLPLMTQQEVRREIVKVKAKEIQQACRKYLVESPQVTAWVS